MIPSLVAIRQSWRAALPGCDPCRSLRALTQGSVWRVDVTGVWIYSNIRSSRIAFGLR